LKIWGGIAKKYQINLDIRENFGGSITGHLYTADEQMPYILKCLHYFISENTSKEEKSLDNKTTQGVVEVIEKQPENPQKGIN